MSEKTKVEKDLTIHPVILDQVESKKWDDLDHRLPKPPFLIVLNGPCASGKSVCLMNLLYNENYYRDKFDSVVICSPSIMNDTTWKVAVEDEKNTILSENLEDLEAIIDAIFKIQLERVEEAEREGVEIPHLLLILDDCVGFVRKCPQFTRHRHPRISILIATQDFRSLSPVIRTNASHYMIYRTQNDGEMKKIIEEFGGQFGNSKMLELMDTATSERFSFLTLHKRTMKAYKKFEELLYDKYGEEQ